MKILRQIRQMDLHCTLFMMKYSKPIKSRSVFTLSFLDHHLVVPPTVMLQPNIYKFGSNISGKLVIVTQLALFYLAWVGESAGWPIFKVGPAKQCQQSTCRIWFKKKLQRHTLWENLFTSHQNMNNWVSRRNESTSVLTWIYTYL